MTKWTKEDFIINKGSFISLSKEGEKKLTNTDTLIIPEGVTNVSDEALKEKKFKKLVLPSTLVVIGENAFLNCGIEEIEGGENVIDIFAFSFKNNNLKSVKGFLNLKRISPYAFSRNKIYDFYFGKDLELISIDAFEDNRFKKLDFSNCAGLEVKEEAFMRNLISEVKLGKRMKITKEAFRFNKLKSDEFIDSDITEPALYSEEAKPDNSWTKEHFLFKDDAFVGLSEEGFKKLKTANNITFPSVENITKIEIKFSRLDYIYEPCFKEVYISEGIEEIGYEAFCLKRIEKLHLPESLKIIGKEAFQGISVKSIKFPKNLKSIHYEAFAFSQLQSVDLSETKITEIPDECFRFCMYLKEVKLPRSLESIESSAFEKTYSLLKITVPGDIAWIGPLAFYESGLEEIDIKNPRNLGAIKDCAFKDSRLKYFPFEKMEYVEVIGFQAFERNDIEEVSIKEGYEIRGDAFKYNNIKKVNIRNVENLSEEAFTSNNIKEFNVSDYTNIVSDDVFYD